MFVPEVKSQERRRQYPVRQGFVERVTKTYAAQRWRQHTNPNAAVKKGQTAGSVSKHERLQVNWKIFGCQLLLKMFPNNQRDHTFELSHPNARVELAGEHDGFEARAQGV